MNPTQPSAPDPLSTPAGPDAAPRPASADPARDALPGSVLIAGCGYVGRRLAELLVDDGVRVTGLRRNPDALPDGVQPFAADVTEPASLTALPPTDALVYAVSPTGRTEDAYRQAYVDGLRNVLRAAGRRGALKRVVLVSSTGVYGHTDGSRVDEDTDPRPDGATAPVILEGEALVREGEWRDLGGEERARGIVLRLGGIYGPGRTRTIRRVATGEARCPDPDQYGNRIHRDDAARALRHLLTLPAPSSIYLGVDRDPAPLREVYGWVAGQAGAPDPCQDTEGADAGAESGGRRGNKRCSSDRLVASGFEFRYPTFREGYGALMEEITG